MLAASGPALADHHGELRTIALAEANVAASLAYVTLIGALSLAAALHAGWRVALLASLAVPALLWWSNRRLAIEALPSSRVTRGRLPGVFWIAAAILFCTTAAEWCMAAWGATFVEEAAGLSTDTAVGLMAGYFGGVVVGRVLGSRLVTVGALADAISLKAALGVVPPFLALAATGLLLLRRARTRSSRARETAVATADQAD